MLLHSWQGTGLGLWPDILCVAAPLLCVPHLSRAGDTAWARWHSPRAVVAESKPLATLNYRHSHLAVLEAGSPKSGSGLCLARPAGSRVFPASSSSWYLLQSSASSAGGHLSLCCHIFPCVCVLSKFLLSSFLPAFIPIYFGTEFELRALALSCISTLPLVFLSRRSSKSPLLAPG